MLALLVVLAAGDTTGYWQQQVAYRITASLDEPSGVLSGREHISYVNRSPATLRDFYVHQYLNAFRPGSRWAATDSAERARAHQLRQPLARHAAGLLRAPVSQRLPPRLPLGRDGLC